MATQDQVLWTSANISTGGETKSFTRGDLLPEAVTAEEVSERSLLRIGGAIRTVEVVYTAEELAEQATLRAEATAAAAVALDVDTSLPAGEQTPGTAAPGPPTLVTGAGSPVVIGSKDDKAAAADKTASDKTAADDKGRGGAARPVSKG